VLVPFARKLFVVGIVPEGRTRRIGDHDTLQVESSIADIAEDK
jgi:hypothetical protein